ncbi:MAG: 4Fe-4S dicluster domain-containing protein [Proteobacteria bacterium]|nr:4Fe-4S dicluster domain-containing protein [Pseudomonadota bacterium]MBU1581367.1 4Fe-4S dicluster domain-containing protein [Pseudomonadota bacterium]MBU2455305.1 4Fe-4S dicluster domain-containing protein [Pseudomonadota bacterium]MBU2629806.1 4Fe-4S dicluster domain-containing protein [Pseudomonadota bacterium]
MAHHTIKSSYTDLVNRLNRFPQGAPPSRLLNQILNLLFSENEARLVSLLPIKPFTAKKAGRIWKKDLTATQKILDALCSRAILVDMEYEGESHYALPPPMAGFFEFSLMRIRNDIDQKALSELFYQYLNVEEDFIKKLFTLGDTQLGRVFVHEPVLSNENALHVLDYERASQVIKTASHRGIGTCYCRHKMRHMDKACDGPMDICMTFNTSARSLIKYGHARSVDVAEGLDLLDLAYESNLVQFGENVRQEVNFICNCCGCCCEAMIAARRFAIFTPVHTTNFIPRIDPFTCNGCGNCVTICPVEAMALVSANDGHHPRKKKARLNKDICLGCGLCVRSCTQNSLCLDALPQRVITPLDSTYRIVLMAIERGSLQHLIFDNRVLFSHRALAAVLGVILKLPPVKKALASKQLQSRYLETMINFLN